MSNPKRIEWILRISIAGEFIGHGIFALQVKQGWIPYFTALGFSHQTGAALLPIIGIFDIALAILILIKPVRIVILWMALWGFWTALVRPLAGEPIWDFVERFTNWGAPLALFFIYEIPRNLKEWFSSKKTKNTE